MLKCFGSGSKGNCYALMVNDEILVLDAGIKYKECLKGIDYRISDVVGVFVSHSHNDHSSFISEWKKQGIPIFEPYKGGSQNIQLGNFSLYAFQLPHDGEENRGVLIFHKDIGYVLYLTDLQYCPYTFKKYEVETIIVEANWDGKYVNKDAQNWQHIINGHMSLQECVKFIQSNQTDRLKNVILAHLSAENSCCKYFLSETEKCVDKAVNVQIAKKGLEVNL